MNPLIQPKTITSPLLITLTLLCIGLLPRAYGVLPAPDGGYPNFTTAEGTNALQSLTTGAANTAVGWYSLFSNTDGSFNTALGAGTLLFNIGNQNTGEGTQNTAIGTAALLFNTTGTQNTANGSGALGGNGHGDNNTATGYQALGSNTDGDENTATGEHALYSNTTGSGNTAIGDFALFSNTTGGANVALGTGAGVDATTGNYNVYIGAGLFGVAGESNACYIASIFGQTSATGIPVLIDSNNKLGTTTSSKRFKHEIKPMDNASEALFSLKPVTFRYKKDIDPAGTRQLGLVAEEVEKVNRDLVVRDKDGKPYSVRYDQVNAMLLNEFLKEHRTVQELKSTVARQEATILQQKNDFQAIASQQQKQIEALTRGLQKVSAQLEASKPAQQMVNNP